ncbi:unnamed protein product [Closterium sp. NIES-65]|nr:unnamed protein product [Closterium sp. NIES-65]
MCIDWNACIAAMGGEKHGGEIRPGAVADAAASPAMGSEASAAAEQDSSKLLSSHAEKADSGTNGAKTNSSRSMQEADGNIALAIIEEGFALAGTFNIADFVPWLSYLDPQHIYARTKRLVPQQHGLMRACIAERRHLLLKTRSGGREKPEDSALVDALFEIEGEGEDKVDKDEMLLLAIDMMMAGTDTTAKTVEWALAELAQHPDMLERLRAEVDAAYSSVTLGGYHIPPNTMIQINGWDLAHDPTVWINPHKFDPSRFLDPAAPGMTGQNFSLLPFGSGRRGCLGTNMGLDLSARLLANFVLRFDFELPGDVKAAGGVDMTETFGLTMALAKPLRLVVRERKAVVGAVGRAAVGSTVVTAGAGCRGVSVGAVGVPVGAEDFQRVQWEFQWE